MWSVSSEVMFWLSASGGVMVYVMLGWCLAAFVARLGIVVEVCVPGRRKKGAMMMCVEPRLTHLLNASWSDGGVWVSCACWMILYWVVWRSCEIIFEMMAVDWVCVEPCEMMMSAVVCGGLVVMLVTHC